MKNIGIKLVTLGLLATTVLAPMSANADVHRKDNKGNDFLKVVVSLFNRDVRYDNDHRDFDRDDRGRWDDRDGRDKRDARDNRDNDRRESRNDNRGRK